MPRAKRATDAEPLVKWEDAPPQVNVLDWRKRASSYGLKRPVEEDGGADETDFERAPEQLIGEEDPEALEEQPLQTEAVDGLNADELNQEPPEQGVYGADVDLVRMYLQQVGRRPLLTPLQE